MAPRWKWVQVPDFQHPIHPEWDVLQWNLEDELVHDPRKVAVPVHEPPDEWFYFFSKHAPGLQELPACLVLFRIAAEPVGDEPGVIEGWGAWWNDELYDALFALAQSFRGR
jgi:hypothetical protein